MFVVLFVWQLFNFFVIWVWSLPARIPQPISFEWPMMIMGAAVTLALVWMTLRPGEEASLGRLVSHSTKESYVKRLNLL